MTRLEMYKQRMDELGIEAAKKSLGQNFLVSDRVISEIIKEALSDEANHLIEVGPGLGALTEDLVTSGRKLTLIELDRVLAEYWRSRSQEVIEKDALQFDWSALPSKMTSVFVSNLPYQISSSIVIERSLDEEPFLKMVLMFQKEVAERIQAKHNTDAYGLLSVMAQAFWDVKIVTNAGTNDFYPAPRVQSRVLVFRRKKSPVENKKRFLTFIKLAFAQRRKILVTNVKSQFVEAEFISELEKLGYDSKVRAEKLKVSDFILLYKALKEK